MCDVEVSGIDTKARKHYFSQGLPWDLEKQCFTIINVTHDNATSRKSYLELSSLHYYKAKVAASNSHH